LTPIIFRSAVPDIKPPPGGDNNRRVVKYPMSLIVCTGDCLYQRDGYCTLERAMSSGEPTGEHPCVNYVPRASQNGGQRLSDIAHADKL
jgi:hypothetical protein